MSSLDMEVINYYFLDNGTTSPVTYREFALMCDLARKHNMPPYSLSSKQFAFIKGLLTPAKPKGMDPVDKILQGIE